MPIADALRWNDRYRNKTEESLRGPHGFLVESAPYLPARGLALDAAMGLGGDAGFLLERGLRVVGVDISEVAVRRARARRPGLLAVVADLTRFALPAETFDLILNFYYLQRDLWPQYRRALKPGGVLVFETLTREMLAQMPEAAPAYLLAPGELRAAFGDWEVLAYREGWNSPDDPWHRAVASLVVRRPA
jgi:SAM-dependent methyltransferase